MTLIPTTMSAVQLVGHGGLDKLVYNGAVPVPGPASDEVLIRVTACGMNNTDVWVRQGAYGTEDDAAAVSTWRRCSASRSPSQSLSSLEAMNLYSRFCSM